ncbi:MAG: hypothetical protein OXL96_25495 [Candidatus Poribacteria bacterium]|nr:hypothetical protein [Candidatus Poribacteria bacterium]
MTEYDYKFLLGVLNSHLINWYFINFLSENLHFYPSDAKELPIPDVTLKQQKPIIELVNRIIKAKNKNTKADTKQFEAKIDELVYHIYGLSTKHIAMITTD